MDHFQKHYFEILDNAINGIKSRFDQPGYAQYSKVESVLLKAMKVEDFTEEFEFVCALYKDEVISTPLKIPVPLETLASQISDKNSILLELIKYMKHLCPSQFPMFSKLVTLLILVINHSTNCAIELSFSAI